MVFRIERKQSNGRYRAIPGLVYASAKEARTALGRIRQASPLHVSAGLFNFRVKAVRHA